MGEATFKPGEKLEPLGCPFCGGAAAHGLWGNGRMAVRCLRCDALGPTTDLVPEVCMDIRQFIDKAIDAWNRRVSASPAERGASAPGVYFLPDNEAPAEHRDEPPIPVGTEGEFQGCVNHPGRRVRTNLDGDDLCQECADAWARAEGQAAWDAEREALPDPPSTEGQG